MDKESQHKTTYPEPGKIESRGYAWIYWHGKGFSQQDKSTVIKTNNQKLRPHDAKNFLYSKEQHSDKSDS